MSAYITAPVGTTLVNNDQTGPRLDAGQNLFVCNDSGSGSGTAAWTINGYTYTNP